MTLATGTRFGPYEITGVLGAGGMGEVYRAHDPRLGRDVALKVLPDLFATDPERLARFQREAQILAALNHPHIAGIHGLEDGPAPDFAHGASSGKEAGPHVRALVLELVEGETLADLIGRGPIPLDEALPIAKQIADALEAAHEHGIIHRDLKPSNIKVTPDDVVKVLDFGLAKLTDVGRVPRSGPAAGTEQDAAHLTMSPTITSPAMMTGVGVILGTAAYMSPEQAKGREADKRSDVWAYGCLLYEMLAGRRAFEGEDVSDTLAAVLRGEPDWTALPATTPPAVRSVLHRCLEKDRKRRLHDIGDAGILLDDLSNMQATAAGMTHSPAAARGRRRERVAWALVGILVVAATGLAIPYFRGTAVDARSTRFSVSLPTNATLSNAISQIVSVLSPDGRRLAFIASGIGGAQVLWVRSLDTLEAHPLPGTELAGGGLPFWSPDSRSIAFFSQGRLKTIEAAGGPVQSLCDAPAPRGGAWSQDGVIMFAPSPFGGLFSVPAAGGQPKPLTAVDRSRASASHRFPSFLPDGRHFTFLAWPDNEIRIGSLDTTETMRLLSADSQAQYAAPGYVLFARQGTLLAQPFEARRATLGGDAVPLVERVAGDSNGYAAFSASGNGTLAYRTGRTSETTQLTWLDRAGKPLGSVGRPGAYRNPILSPDGTRAALEVVDPLGRNQDIWILELARGVLSRFTFDSHNDVMPVWSPDSTRIAFGSDRDGGVFSLYQKLSNGAAGEELLFKSSSENAIPFSWSPDGRFILHRFMANGFFNTGVLPVSGDRKSHLFQQSSFSQVIGQVSPDGRWIAYQSNESGPYEVYAQTFPTPGGKWQISKDGGVFAKWRADGKELFYYASDGQLMAVPIKSDAALQVGTAVPLFKARMLNGPTTSVGFRAQYDVTPDGQRFLINAPTEEAVAAPITVVLNWTAALKK